jgi:pilus assembly protein Flp/PilA
MLNTLVSTLVGWLQSRVSLRDETGATAVEYGIMVALIAAVIVVIVAALGTEVRDAFQTVCTAINGGVAC